MYRHVDVEGNDRVEPLEAAGFTFVIIGGATAFRLPCKAFAGGCCSVYEDRPSVCRSYRCLLLRRQEAGEISREDALALIARTIELRNQVRAGLTACLGPKEPAPLEDLYRLMMAKFEAAPDPAAARKERAEFLLTVAALRVILAREFEPRDSKSHRPDEGPAAKRD
jgi:Fe-S-cluster containining protein